MKKKILSIALVAVMAATMLCACGKKEASGMTVNEGVLTMATNAYFPPYEYYEGEEIVGIDADILPVMFEGNLHQDESEKLDGGRNMGIGLSVCMSIIKAHKGNMWAENRNEGGARMSFSLRLQ